MHRLERYTSEKKEDWDNLIRRSKNGTFLFERNYMDYHSERFNDYSLLFYRKDKLEAVFPANINEKTIYSHQGLTYGGLVYTVKLSTKEILDIFEIMLIHYKSVEVEKIIYKSIPYIYSQYPAQEDLYALYKNNFKLIGCNISSTIELANKIKFTESRKSGIRKAKKYNLNVSESGDYDSFWKILNDNLEVRYAKRPVHNIKEIILLANRFPNNVKLYLACELKTPLAGAVLYINKNIVHVQYISSSERGKEIGAIDILFDHLINNVYMKFEYFDFGQSTENNGEYLNENLIFQKEGFGARGVVYNIYEKVL